MEKTLKSQVTRSLTLHKQSYMGVWDLISHVCKSEGDRLGSPHRLKLLTGMYILLFVSGFCSQLHCKQILLCGYFISISLFVYIYTHTHTYCVCVMHTHTHLHLCVKCKQNYYISFRMLFSDLLSSVSVKWECWSSKRGFKSPHLGKDYPSQGSV